MSLEKKLFVRYRKIRQLTERVRGERVGRRLRLFGRQIRDRQAWCLLVWRKCIQCWFACAGMQAGMRGRRLLLLLLLNQQNLGQLPLVLLDLLLHVIDCTCNLTHTNTNAEYGWSEECCNIHNLMFQSLTFKHYKNMSWYNHWVTASIVLTVGLMVSRASEAKGRALTIF